MAGFYCVNGHPLQNEEQLCAQCGAPYAGKRLGKFQANVVRKAREKKGLIEPGTEGEWWKQTLINTSVSFCKYLGGHASRDKPKDGVTVSFTNDGISVRSFKELFSVPWEEVRDLEVEGNSEVSRRITATRLLTLGIFALAAKKKQVENHSYLTITTKDSEILIENEKKTPQQLRATLSPLIAKVKATQNPEPPSSSESQTPLSVPAGVPTGDPVQRLKQLAELRDAGIVTPEEFEAKKAKLLNEM